MNDFESPWPTTQPQSHRASGPRRVSLHDALAPGSRLGEFEIVRVLGTGAFGIVYLAHDHVLLRDVAIKEYMPASLAGRRDGFPIALRSPAFAAPFERGLESFLSEARLLASFDHPSLVKVHRFWQGNGTAYMAMQYYPGATLREVRRTMSAAPDESWLMRLVEPLLGALDVLHGQGVFHRDISPDNILILPHGRPVLLDFGSARRVIANTPQFLTALLTPSFAPIEQYASEAEMRQGPWTDLYALGATLRFVLEGSAPTPSVLRAVSDVLPTLAPAPVGEAQPARAAPLLATIDWMMALAPEERPRDVEAVRRALRGEIVPPLPSPRVAAWRAEAAAIETQAPPSSTPQAGPGSQPDAQPHEAEPPPGPAAAAPATPAAEAHVETAPDSRGARDPRRIVGAMALLGLAVCAVGAWTLDGAGRASPALTSLAAALRAQPAHAPALVASGREPGSASAGPLAGPAVVSAAPSVVSVSRAAGTRVDSAAPALARASDSFVPVAASAVEPESAGSSSAAPARVQASSAGAPPMPAEGAERKTPPRARAGAHGGAVARAPQVASRGPTPNVHPRAKSSAPNGGCTGASILTRLMCSMRECKATTPSASRHCGQRYARTGEAA